MKNIFAPVILPIMILLLWPEARAQQGTLYVRHWYCCLDGKLFETEKLKPQEREKMGRRQDVLCPGCKKQFGDLAKDYRRRYQ